MLFLFLAFAAYVLHVWIKTILKFALTRFFNLIPGIMTAVFNRSSNETFLILWYIEIFEGLHLPGTTDGSYITPVIEIQCIYFQINATKQNTYSFKSFRFLHVEILNWNCSLWKIKNSCSSFNFFQNLLFYF